MIRRPCSAFHKLTRNARALRRKQTAAERALWQALRDQKPRFTRGQLVVGHFIIDLACRSAKVGIELDGSQHGEQIEADQQRTKMIQGRKAGPYYDFGTTT
ncbi:endonuclease domain-containing protein [Sphingomonas sp. MMS24-JH45]